MNIDAVDKMVSTHLQQNFDSRRPIDLPAFRNPIDAFRGPSSRNTLTRNPSGSRFVVTESESKKPALRKQPVFFSKFDGEKVDNKQDIQLDNNPNEIQLPRQSKNLRDRTSPQQNGRSDGFSSFPQRSSLNSLPQRQLNDVALQPRLSTSRLEQPSLSPQQPQQQSRIQFTVQQQPRNEVEAVPLSRQVSRFQQQSRQNQFSQQPQQNQFSQQPQQNQFSQQFTQQQPQYQQAPRFEPQQVAPLPPPDVPGIEAHLAETAKIIALQQSQAKKAAVLEAKRLGELAQQQSNKNRQQNRFQEQNRFQQQNNFQQQYTFQQQNNYQQQNNFQQQNTFQQPQSQRFQSQQQNEPQPQVPGLAEHQRQLQEHRALVQQSQPQQLPQQQQQQQQQQQTQFNVQFNVQQPQQQVLATHQQGLEQHSRYVAELQAAQNALNG